MEGPSLRSLIYLGPTSNAINFMNYILVSFPKADLPALYVSDELVWLSEENISTNGSSNGSVTRRNVQVVIISKFIDSLLMPR